MKNIVYITLSHSSLQLLLLLHHRYHFSHVIKRIKEAFVSFTAAHVSLLTFKSVSQLNSKLFLNDVHRSTFL